jgi:hypothetical protein
MVNTCNSWNDYQPYWVVYTTTCQTICPAAGRHLLAEADDGEEASNTIEAPKPLPMPTKEWIAEQDNWVRADATNSVNVTVRDGVPGRRLLATDASSSSAEAGNTIEAPKPLPVPTQEWIAEQDNWVHADAANSVNVTVHA